MYLIAGCLGLQERCDKRQLPKRRTTLHLRPEMQSAPETSLYFLLSTSKGNGPITAACHCHNRSTVHHWATGSLVQCSFWVVERYSAQGIFHFQRIHTFSIITINSRIQNDHESVQSN